MPFTAELRRSKSGLDEPSGFIGSRESSAYHLKWEDILTNLPGLPAEKDTGILIFRDYSSNVPRMVQVLEKLEAQ